MQQQIPQHPTERTRTRQRRARRLAIAGVAALAAGGAIAGCASLGRNVFETPVVTFRDMRVQGVGLQGGTIDVLLNVYNPNGYSLEATRLNYRLVVDSVPVGTGALEERFRVSSGDTTVVRLPITFTYAGLGSVGRKLLSQGAVNYRVLGDVTVATPVGSFTRPFDRTGQFTSFGQAR